MSVSQHEEKMINLQHQMRQNQSELQSYLAGLDDWTSEIKEKEKNLKTQGTSSKDKKEDLPPVRNTIDKKKLKKKKKEKKPDPKKPKRISGFDFRAWDKFDVDKALEEIEETEQKAETSSSEYETDEEWEMERKKHLAELEKDKGNKFLKNGDLERAVEAYTKGIEFDATNSILPANRALALIKQQKFGAAELDCTTSIVLDPLYVKAYLRRATARAGVGKVEDSLSDYRRVLDLEPSNRQAKAEIERLEKELQREKEGPVTSSFTEGQIGVVKPVYKSLEDRSKAPMKRIVIEEIGVEPVGRTKQNTARQSEVAQKITAMEGEAFDSMFKSPQSVRAEPDADSPKILDITSRVDSLPENASTKSLNNSHNERLMPTQDHNLKPDSERSKDDQARIQTGQYKTAEDKRTSRSEPTPPSTNSKQSTPHPTTNGTGGGDAFNFQVPQSSFQFQADFKLLKKRPEEFLQYFQAIPPSSYPKLFGQCLDADILNTVLKSLSLSPSQSEIDLFDILDHLTLVKRFSMTAMFLSGKDKKVVEDLLKRVSGAKRHTEEQVSALRKKYQL